MTELFVISFKRETTLADYIHTLTRTQPFERGAGSIMADREYLPVCEAVEEHG